jgi:vacuolar-type H+-ATPase subunit D/Vma8
MAKAKKDPMFKLLEAEESKLAAANKKLSPLYEKREKLVKEMAPIEKKMREINTEIKKHLPARAESQQRARKLRQVLGLTKEINMPADTIQVGSKGSDSKMGK